METPYSRHSFPETSLLKRGLIPLFLLLLVGFAACGGSQSTIQPTMGQPTTVPHLTTNLTVKINPCSLITQSQIEQVLKTSMSVTPPQTDPNGNYLPENPCSYTSGDNNIFTQIFLATFQDAATAKANFHNFATSGSGSDFHSISSLGEQALLAAKPVPELFVQKDNGILTVGVVSNASLSDVESQEQQLAQIALQNI